MVTSTTYFETNCEDDYSEINKYLQRFNSEKKEVLNMKNEGD